MSWFLFIHHYSPLEKTSLLWTTTKKWTDEPKTWEVWQSAGFSSLKQYRLSRHTGEEQVYFSAWWSDSHKLCVLIFPFFLLVFLLLFVIDLFVLNIQYLSLLLQSCFFVQCAINLPSHNLQRKQTKKKAHDSNYEALKKHRIKYL